MSRTLIGLFYGSSTCYTEMAAERIREILGTDRVDLHNIAETPVSLMSGYRYLILGIPTWDYGELQEDWEECWDDLDGVNLDAATVAIFGLGDQVGYPEWFQDALGFLWAKAIQQGARTVGLWPNEGYSFRESKALTANGSHFLGLALDDENQLELTEARLQAWCAQVMVEFGLDSPEL